MKPTAILYVSDSGHTARYAVMLGEKTGLPVYPLQDAKTAIHKGEPVLFLGWLRAGSVVGYKAAARRFSLCAVGAVGLCPTGALLEEVRKTIRLPEEIPLFTIQGGMDRGRLRGINKSMIDMLIKMMRKKKNKTPEEEAMLDMILKGGDFVSEEHLTALLEWCSL